MALAPSRQRTQNHARIPAVHKNVRILVSQVTNDSWICEARHNRNRRFAMMMRRAHEFEKHSWSCGDCNFELGFVACGLVEAFGSCASGARPRRFSINQPSPGAKASAEGRAPALVRNFHVFDVGEERAAARRG